MIWRQLLVPVLGLLACSDTRVADTSTAADLNAPAAPIVASAAPTPDSVQPVAVGGAKIVNPLASLVDSSYSDTGAVRQRVDSVIAIGNARPDRVLLFARISEGDTLVAVKDSLSWPEEVETRFTLLFDDNGKLMLHTEVPTSESGDWYMVSEHFFNSQGHTVFYRAHVSGFGSECASIVRETVETFFNPTTGAPVARVATITDGDGKPIRDTSSCFLRIKSAPPPQRLFSDLARP